mgnify:CR=1 FL=1
MESVVCLGAQGVEDQSLVLVRGCSGSGKRSLVKRWLKHCKRVDADPVAYGENHSFDNLEGDSLVFRRAARWALDAAASHLAAGDSVAVSISLLAEKSLLPWLRLAERRRARFAVIECHGEFENLHGLPAHYIAQQRAAFEPAETLSRAGIPVLFAEEIADQRALAGAPIRVEKKWLTDLGSRLGQ